MRRRALVHGHSHCSVGNFRGIRIPKVFFNAGRLEGVELEAKEDLLFDPADALPRASRGMGGSLP